MEPASPSRFVRERMFELQVHTRRATHQHLWEKSLGEYLLSNAELGAFKQPRELDEEGRAQLCEIYLDSAKELRDAAWLEQSAALLHTALLYMKDNDAILDELEDTIFEWVDFLEVDDAFCQAALLLEGQWERRASDAVSERLHALLSSWVYFLRENNDPEGAEILAGYLSTRQEQWEYLKAEWAQQQEQQEADPPDLSEIGL